MDTITLTSEQAQDLLAAIIRMEHKTTGRMKVDEYWAACALAQAVQAPQFITEYFARKANDESFQSTLQEHMATKL